MHVSRVFPIFLSASLFLFVFFIFLMTFAFFILFFPLIFLCHFLPLVLVLCAYVCLYILVLCWCSCLVAIPCSLPSSSTSNPSGEPVVPRGPQLSALSLRSSFHFSPTLPRCRPNPLTANGKPERHRHLPERQLCHRRRGGRLRQSVPHSAVLSVDRVALQQVRPRPPP